MQLSFHVVLAAIFLLILVAGWLASLIWVVHQVSARQPLLPLERRRRVPWTGGITAAILVGFFLVREIPAIYFVLTADDAGIAALQGDGSPEAQLQSTKQLLDLSYVSASLVTGFCLAVAFLLVKRTPTRLRDLGLEPHRLPGDVLRGIVAFGVISLPMLGISAALNYLFEPSAQHPVLEMLQSEDASAATWLATFTMTVLLAPFYEEFLFRGIFQGYLERIFVPRGSLPGIAGGEVNSGAWPGFIRFAWNWAPVFISSTVFAALHFNGDSPDPIPLFFFALALGYVYRQTHRLWPCIVLHMCLNATSLFFVWVGSGLEAEKNELTQPVGAFVTEFASCICRLCL